MTDGELKLLKTYDIYISGQTQRVEDNDGWSIGDDDTSEADYEKYKSVKNRNLTKAKKAKNDDFYTQLSDIEAELKHYEDKFRGKVVYLPCDVAHKGESGESVVSNFWVYFHLNFQRLGLKKLIATNIDQMRVEAPMNEGTYKAFIYENTNAEYSGLDNDTTKFTRVEEITGNGDFRSDACRQLMREADIIVTNPPFSLFREFVAQIMEFRKKFIIIGNQNCISYKEFFTFLFDGRAWLGATPAKSKTFEIPATYYIGSTSQSQSDGKYYQALGNTCWFTNLDHKYHNRPMQSLIKDGVVSGFGIYTKEKYPKYDNYDAINVQTVKDIPLDYFEPMGVPITFLQYFNSDEFDLIGLLIDYKGEHFIQGRPVYTDERHKHSTCAVLNGKRQYAKLLIKRKTIPVEAEFLQSFVDGVAMTLEEVTDAFMDYSGDLFSTFFTNCRSELQSAKRDKNEYQILKSDNELEINCGSGYKILLGIADATHLTYTKLVKPEKEGA